MTRILCAVLFALIGVCSPALACSCAPTARNVIEASTDVVFDGTVLSQRIGVDRAGEKAAVIRVRIDRMIKGKRPASGVMMLYSHWSPMMCGVTYPPGFVGRFGAKMSAGGPRTNNCTHFGLNRDYFR